MPELDADRVRTLQRAEERFQLVTQNIDVVIFIATADLSDISYVNEAFESVYGRPVEAVREHPRLLLEAVHPDDREAYESALERLQADFEDGEPESVYEGEYRIQRGSEQRWVRMARYPIRTGDGGDYRYVGLVQDVTDHRELEHTYQKTFDNISDGLVVHDPETGNIIDVNERFCEMNGYERGELIGESIDRITADEEGYSYEDAQQRIQRAREHGPQLFEWRNQRKDGTTFPVEVHLALVELTQDERVLASVRDITDRKRHQGVLRALHDTTEQIQVAETPEAVCEATVDAAKEVLGLSMPACWLPTASGGEDGPILTPVAASDPAWEMPGGPGEFEPGTFEYELYEDREMAVYDPSERWNQTPLELAFLIPLGEHGLFGAAEPGVESYDDAILDAARILARHATSALDRIARERERRESERRLRAILNRIDEAIYLTREDEFDPGAHDPEHFSAGYEEVFGITYEEIDNDDSMNFFDIVHPDDRSGYRDELEELGRHLDDGSFSNRYTYEYRVVPPDDDQRWIRSDFYPVEWGDDERRIIIVSRDITDRRERERTLKTFHEATRELTAAGSRQEASQRALDAAEQVLGFPLVSVHLYDEGEGSLRPVAETDSLRDELDFLPSFEPGDSLPWKVFVDNEPVRGSEVEASTSIYGPDVADPDLYLPLGPHGAMLVGAPGRTFDTETLELAQILAATLEAALNHIKGRQELEEREAELREHRERADRLEALNTVIREIEQATIEESTRDGIEKAVCERLTTMESYTAAWIAEPGTTADALVARTSSGADSGVRDTLPVEPTADGIDRHPAAIAFETRTVSVVGNLVTDTSQCDWRKAALRVGYQSLVAVPLVYDDTIHGILTIASNEADAFDDHTQAVLAELGRSVGHAIAVLKRREALESDTTTELELETHDDGLLFVRLSADPAATVTLEGVVRQSGGSVGVFYTVEDANPDTVVERAASAPEVDAVERIKEDATDETCLLEVVQDSWFGTIVSEHGGIVRSARAENGTGRWLAEVPQGTDVRQLVESVQDQYPQTDLAAQRTRDRTIKTLMELQDILDDQLTQRQLEAVETAYSAGYFEWPRESSGEDIADLLDITQPTFNKHLRAAERKTFSMLLDREYPD